jgi:hypothetical protein
MSYAIVAALAYLFLVGLIYAPQCPQAENPTAPIDYFPEPTPEPQPAPQVTPAPQVFQGWETAETEPETVATIVTLARQALAQLTPETQPQANPALDLTALTIRQLKKMASAAKVKNYGTMKKHELITALA